MADYRVISSDNHVIEPVDLWTSRASQSSKTNCLTWKVWMRVIGGSATVRI